MPDLGILACPYDSRGMDLLGPNTERLGQLYTQFDAWLLDHGPAWPRCSALSPVAQPRSARS
ncbi:DUF3885 domain-containing protein [Deinococcus radiophilus]|uniref:DUF3885 domain-containing protein n=1 Tax=Deinococcus radiophilus TaxID=32062 RepID=UPI0014727757